MKPISSSKFYDRMMAPVEAACLAERRSRLLESVNGSVLEIGVGTGVNTLYYSAQVRLVVSDPDPSIYAPLLEKAEGSNLTLDFLSSTAEALPFPTASFDHVVSTLVLCSVDSPKQALAEIRRVLKPGGQFLFLEHIRASAKRQFVQDLIQPLWTRVSSGCHPNRPMVASIRESGFRIESVELFDPFSSFSRPTRFVLQFLTPFAQGVARKE